MTEPTGKRTPGAPGSRWIRLAGLVALAILCAAAIRGWAPRTSPSRAPAAGARAAAPPAATPSKPDPGPSGQARKRPPAPGAPSAKDRWVDDVPGADLADLDPPRREIFLQFANAERCTCGCGYTLAGCRAYDPTCEVSLPRIEGLLDSVRDGHIREARGVRSRPPTLRRAGRRLTASASSG